MQGCHCCGVTKEEHLFAALWNTAIKSKIKKKKRLTTATRFPWRTTHCSSRQVHLCHLSPSISRYQFIFLKNSIAKGWEPLLFGNFSEVECYSWQTLLAHYGKYYQSRAWYRQCNWQLYTGFSSTLNTSENWKSRHLKQLFVGKSHNPQNPNPNPINNASYFWTLHIWLIVRKSQWFKIWLWIGVRAARM